MPLDTNLFKLILRGEVHGQRTENSFHFRAALDSPSTNIQEDCEILALDFASELLPLFQAFASDDWKAKTIRTVTLNPAGLGLTEIAIQNGTGFQQGDGLPSFCAGLLSLRTGFGGRSRHGRLYVPGVAEDAQEESRLVGANLTQLRDIGGMLIGRYGVGGSSTRFRYGVYSPKLGDTPNAGPPPSIEHSISGFTQVTQIVARNEIATMRKRALHHGE